MSQPDEPRRPRPAKARPQVGDDTFARRDDSARRPAKTPPADPLARPRTPRPDPEDEDRPRPDGMARRSRIEREPRVESGGPKLAERILFGRVSSAHLATFCRQFAAYSDAGVDLVKSLQGLERQFARTALGPVLNRVTLRIRQGETIAESMAVEPDAFDKLAIAMVRVAEARGGIPETMRGLADHYDARVRLVRQARSAAIYPVIVLVLAAGVCALLTVYLLPMFASLLADLGSKTGGESSLPLPSRVLMGFSHFVKSAGWWLIPVLTVGTLVGGFRLYRTRGGKAAMDELAIHLPILGKILRLLDTTRFARTMSSLLAAGVDMNHSLQMTSDVLRTEPFRRVVAGARQGVMEGEELSVTLDDARLFDAGVIAIVESGEETGRLPESLDKLADDYEERVTYMVKNLGNLIQPIIFILLGGLVLFIILAVVLPYISALNALAG